MDLFRRRPPLWALIVLPVLLWLGQYWQRGLWEPDEARYAYVAREMRETGQWLVMHINGDLYPDKPALMFWLINAASVVTGGEINGFSARLPSLFGMILGLWAVARLAQRWADASAAWRAVLVTMTAFLVWQEGGWGRIDALLFGFELAAIYHLFSYNDDGRRWRLLAAYGLLGLGTFAKGPVAIPVVLGSYLVATLAAGEGAKLRRWHWAWGVALAVLPFAAWLAAARWIAHGPDEYFGAMAGVKFLGRVTNADDHANPFYDYLLHFPGEFLPWTVFLPAAFVALGGGVLRRRLLGWGLFVLVMFSLISGKRPIYILAMYPAAALLVAVAWPKLGGLSRRWTAITGWLAMGLVLLLGVACFAAVAVLNAAPAESKLGLKIAQFTAQLGGASLSWRLFPVGLLMLTGGAWLVRLFRNERLSDRWFAAFAGLNFANFALVGALLLPVLNPVKAPLALVAEVQARLAPGQPIHLYDQQLAIVPLYVDRPGRVLRSPEALELLLRRERSGVVVARADDWAKLFPSLGDRLLAHPFRIGSKRLVWAEFPVPAGATSDPVPPASSATKPGADDAQ